MVAHIRVQRASPVTRFACSADADTLGAQTRRDGDAQAESIPLLDGRVLVAVESLVGEEELCYLRKLDALGLDELLLLL